MNPKSTKNLLRYGWIFILSGTLFLIVGIVAFANRVSFVWQASVAKGTVVELTERRGSRSRTTFSPVYVFTDSGGKERKIYSSSGSYPPSYSVGESVRVYYRSDDPADAALDGFFDLWGVATIFGAIGFVHLVLGIVCTWWQKRGGGKEEFNAV